MKRFQETGLHSPGLKTPIDVLIGSDCYRTIIAGQTIMGDQGPVAIDSKLGWLLSGPLDCLKRTMSTHSCMIIHGTWLIPPWNRTVTL